MVYVVISIIGIVLFINLVMFPVQYRYLESIKDMERENKLKGKKQGEMYDSKNAGEQMIHENAQGNLLFLPANLVASFIYNRKHKKNP